MSGYFQQNPQMVDLQSQLNNLLASYNQLNQNAPMQNSSIPEAVPIQWISGGIEGAKAVHMKPNTQAALFDREGAVFYLRTLDASGTELPIKIGRFTLEDPPVPEDNTVTKQDLLAFKEEIKQMLSNNQRNQNGQRSGYIQNNQNQEAKK